MATQKVYELPEDILLELDACVCACGIYHGGGSGAVH